MIKIEEYKSYLLYQLDNEDREITGAAGSRYERNCILVFKPGTTQAALGHETWSMGDIEIEDVKAMIDIVTKTKTKAPMKKRLEEAEERSTDLMYNLRYSLGNKMKSLYGEYRSADEPKFAEYIGISIASLYNIMHNHFVSEDDFKSICNCLHPTEDLASRWRIMYVLKKDSQIQKEGTR